ncbi:MAG: GAF domain-containing protein [Anaerolineales bacterium]|nr:GAF domain-containing protein [Anaerolineales bacterium]
MGERIGIAVVAVTIFTGVGLYYAETVGFIAFSVENFPLPAMVVAHTFILVITMMLIFAYVRQLTQTLKQLRRDEHRLTISNQELEVIKNTLEERVAARTRGLELVTTLSERLTGILDFDQLLVELVDQVKKGFDYYHAHIYILDQHRQDLIMAAGFGEAGAQMKAKGHHILLDAPTSLVARAARTGKVVNISNVRQAPDWLPNPILPDTRSEMAVPITVDGQVVGVLDVQQNKIDGFDESDADLLRSLANQVAVAIRNARLFDEVETALAEVRAVQQQYIVQSWQTSRSNAQDRERRYIQPGMPEVSEAVVEAAEKQTFVQKRPTIVSMDDVEGSPKLLVAPISLAGQTIGTLQLHKVDNEDASIFWTEQDLEFVETVLDQVAQTAENLRLFEETRERASYEQTVRQITDKLRAAPNLDALLETAARELGQRLGIRHTVLELGVTTMTSPDKELINVMGKRNY